MYSVVIVCVHSFIDYALKLKTCFYPYTQNMWPTIEISSMQFGEQSVNPFAAENPPTFGWRIEPADNITVLLVPRKHVFKIPQ